MATKTEIRTLAMSLRAAPNDAFEISGTAASYNVLSQDLGGFRERLQPGCFARSLRSGDDVKCLFNHDPNQILGRTANKTLTLWDGSDGLNFLCRLNPDSQAHRDLHSSIKRGDISECSFAFAVEDGGEEFDEAKDDKGQRFKRRTLKRAKLLDVSCVTSPAYTGDATSVSARSRVADYDPRRVVVAPCLTDAELRREADRIGDFIRQDAIKDPACRAVKYVDGKFYRDFEKEREIALRKKQTVEDDLDDDDSDWNERAHERAAKGHRAQAQRSTLERGVLHYNAADLHDYAARNFNKTNSRAARRASKKTMPESMVS